MKDWVSLVTNFEAMFEETSRLSTPLAASNGVDFLRCTVHLYKGKESAKVLTNINVAAFYINFLLEVCSPCCRCILSPLIAI